MSEEKQETQEQGDPFVTLKRAQSVVDDIVHKRTREYTWEKCPLNCETVALSKYLSSSKMPFFHQGSIDNVRNKPIVVNGVECGTVQKPNVDELLKQGKQAPFGRGSETVVDTSVRNAVEIGASSFSDSFKELLCSKACKKVHDNMFPFQKIRSELYKMHIYKKGGFFHEHRDTLHGPNHIATLLVSLGSKHRGGDLTVKHHEETEVWHSSYGGSQFACFFTDCDHSVSLVTEGVRVVLQYDVYLDEDSKGKVECSYEDDEDEEDYDEMELWNVDNYAIEKPSDFISEKCGSMILLALTRWFSNNDKSLAFFLSHDYAPSFLSLERLKGHDNLMYKFLSEHYEIYVTNVIVKKTQYEECSSEIEIKPFSMDDWDPHTETFVTNTEKNTKKRKLSNNVLVLIPCTSLDTLESEGYVAFTGNESSPGHCIQKSACMVISKRMEKKNYDRKWCMWCEKYVKQESYPPCRRCKYPLCCRASETLCMSCGEDDYLRFGTCS